MSKALKPCPFCGGDAIVSVNRIAKHITRISCKHCDAGPSGRLGEATAIAEWNRRVPADLLDEAEKALAELVYETTHLSPERDDGSHDARISKGALTAARAALARIRGEQ